MAVAVAVEGVAEEVAHDGAGHAEHHAQHAAPGAESGDAGDSAQSGGQEDVVGTGDAGAHDGEGQGDSGEAEADDGEGAQGHGAAEVIDHDRAEADHDADAQAHHGLLRHVGDVLPGAGAGVLAGEAGLAEDQAGGDAQDNHGDSGQIGGKHAAAQGQTHHLLHK